MWCFDLLQHSISHHELRWKNSGVIPGFYSLLYAGFHQASFRVKIPHEYYERKADRYSNVVTPE
jgi:hypothetical protein